MSKPILSICIPTKNHADILDNTLSKITTDDIFLNTSKVEIVISDNCSEDNTQEICLKYNKMFPDKISYYRQQEDVGDKNFIEVLGYAKGKYAKLNNDKVSFKMNAIKYIVEELEKTEKNVVFFTNSSTKNNRFYAKEFKNFSDFVYYVGHKLTWIGGLCVKKDQYVNVKQKDRFSKLNFGQIDIIAKMSDGGIMAVDGKLMDVAEISGYGGYNPAQIFGENLLILLNILISEKYLSKKAYDKLIKSVLLKIINKYYFDYKCKYSFKKNGYFKYTFKYYKTKPYYYFSYILKSIEFFIKRGKCV